MYLEITIIKGKGKIRDVEFDYNVFLDLINGNDWDIDENWVIKEDDIDWLIEHIKEKYGVNLKGKRLWFSYYADKIKHLKIGEEKKIKTTFKNMLAKEFYMATVTNLKIRS